MRDSNDCTPSQSSSIPEKTLTCREAASFLSARARTLEGWRHRGNGPAYIRQGRSIRYRLSDLIAWQEKNRIEPEAK